MLPCQRLLALALLALGLGSARAQEGAPRSPSVAVVLSGGSAYGMAHIGVLKEIEAAGIPIDIILGTSMGSLVGGLYAAGYSPEEMERIVSGIQWERLFFDRSSDPSDRLDGSLSRRHALRLGLVGGALDLDAGLMEGQAILRLFTELTAHTLAVRNFDELPVRYRSVAADIMSGERVVFDSGSLAEAMRASMSIPALFKPFKVGGRTLVDGGIVDNLPVGLARELGADIVIAVECRAPDPEDAEALRSPLSIAAQSANLMIIRNMRPGREDADVYIRADLRGFSIAGYTDGPGLVARGEEAGRAARAELQALAERLGPSRQAETRERPARAGPPLLDGLRTLGGTEADRLLVETTFRPLLGRAYSSKELAAAIDAVYASGRFDLVRFDVEAGPSSAAGEQALRGRIHLSPKTPHADALFLGFDYRGVYSSVYASDATLSSALLVRGLTGAGSALLASASVINTLKASIEYLQPLGPLYLAPWARYAYEHDVYASEGSPVNLSLSYRGIGAGLWAGLPLGRVSELRVGYAFEDLIDALSMSDDPLRVGTLRAGSLRAAVSVDALDSPILPLRGFELRAYGRLFDPRLGGQLAFTQAELFARAAVPVAPSTSLAIALAASTDLSGLVEGFSEAALPFIATLRKPGMFYGAAEWSLDFIGNHVVGLGLECAYRLGSLHPLIGGDLIAFANASAGLAAISPSLYGDEGSLGLKLSLSVGLGARLSRSFGALVAVGVHNGIDEAHPVVPALTLELGSFSTRVEELR